MDIKIIKTRKEFLTLESDWKYILKNNDNNNFYLTFEWIYSILFLSQFPINNLRIIVFYEVDEAIAIIPCFLNERKKRFFSLSSLELIGNIYSPFRGFIVKYEKLEEVAIRLVFFLMEDMCKEWDVLIFENLSPNDIFFNKLKTIFFKKNLTYTVNEQFVNVVTDLSYYNNSLAFFQNLSKKLRQTVRTGINKMNRNGDFIACLAEDLDGQMNKAIMDYYEIYNDSWKESEADPAFHKNITKSLTNNIRLFILYFKPSDGNKEKSKTFSSFECNIKRGVSPPACYIPIAAHFFIIFGEHVYFLKSAYKEKYSKYSPGVVLFWFSIKHFIDKEHSTLIDHQKGSEGYKLKWGKINETRLLYQLINPISLKGKVEVWFESVILPLLRRIKKVISS